MWNVKNGTKGKQNIIFNKQKSRKRKNLKIENSPPNCIHSSELSNFVIYTAKPSKALLHKIITRQDENELIAVVCRVINDELN
jgi:hypothetical protein